MPLVVYLVPGQTGVVRRGDMVFHIAEPEGEKWKPRWLAHTGIAERTVEEFYLHQAALVIHMGGFVSRDVWSGGDDENESRIDACGMHPDLDDLTRDDIIDHARVYYEIDPSIFQRENVRACYWMGEPLTSGHPLFPNRQSAYAFTCSSFAHYCYSKVVGPLLNISTMPIITDVERVDLEGVMNKDWIQPTPFRRLYPSYLMNAFQQDSYPFSPDDWEIFKHHSVFIPAEVSAA
jgi:hypothetical protein